MINEQKKIILDSIKKIGTRYGYDESFRDVVVCCAYALANRVDFSEEREKEYLRIINKYDKEQQDLFPKILVNLCIIYSKIEEPIDILGDIYEELGLIKKSNAQFFTPIHICELMAKITIDKETEEKHIKERGFTSISDPACGSGRTLYASYGELLDKGIDNDKIFIKGDDIDLTCCCITYIQLSLMGANAVITHQNTLTNKIYDTFYTLSLAYNKELQEKISDKSKEVEEKIEV